MSEPSPRAPHTIRAWHAHVDRIWPSAASHDRALTWLSPAERARYDRFRHDVDREMFLLGRAMARSLVGRALVVAPDAWPWREGPRGRPEIDRPDSPVSFNVAHSGGVVVCAVAHEAEVGIDVEDRRRARLDRELVDRYCSSSEAADIARAGDDWQDRFLRYWTLKEAYLKARGLGIAVHLSDLSFTLGPNGDARVDFLASLAGSDPNWTFDLRDLDDGHYVAIAASTPRGARPRFAFDPLPPEWLPQS
jgi:4'-phosphopantetheinyl transferase